VRTAPNGLRHKRREAMRKLLMKTDVECDGDGNAPYPHVNRSLLHSHQSGRGSDRSARVQRSLLHPYVNTHDSTGDGSGTVVTAAIHILARFVPIVDCFYLPTGQSDLVIVMALAWAIEKGVKQSFTWPFMAQ